MGAMRTTHRLLLVAALLVVCLAPLSPARQRVEYSKLDARPSREWVRDGVIYEIFPRSFSASGNFAGVTAGLDRLEKLGVTILWLMPIHPIGEVQRKGTLGSPYAVRDYYAINPDYGTKDDLKRLVAEAHRRGMKVVIDIVANHTAWDSVMMKTPEFYTHDASGRIVPPVPDWQDVADLDYSNPKLRDYMVEMLEYWVREFDLDGFRCDVAGMVPTDFWERARAELEAVKPDIVMLAEWHEPDLLAKAFDLDYSWPLKDAFNDVLTKGVPATRIRETLDRERGEYERGALHMRFSDNHDEERAIARYGKSGAIAAQALVFTIDGVPMLYSGMEVGDQTESGAPALFERLPVFWGIAERRPAFPAFYAHMIGLRNSSPALRRGTLTWVRNSDEARVVTFARRLGGEEVLVAINFSSAPAVVTIEAASAGYQDVSPRLTPEQPPAAVALPAVALEPYGVRVLRKT
jgi:glycosidase